MGRNTFLMITRFGHGFALSQRTFHNNAEVVTESCEGRVAACFVRDSRNTIYLGWRHPHLTFVNTLAAVDEYQGAVVKPRGPRKKQLTKITEIPDHPKGSVEFNLMRTGGKGNLRDQ